MLATCNAALALSSLATANETIKINTWNFVQRYGINITIYCVWNTHYKSTITNMGVVMVMLMMTMMTMIRITMTCQKHRRVSVSCIFVNSHATAVLSMIQILWNGILCWLVGRYWCLGGSYCLHLQGQGVLFWDRLTWKTKALQPWKMVGTTHPITQHHFLVDLNLWPSQ